CPGQPRELRAFPTRRSSDLIREALDARGVEKAIFVGHDHGAKILRELIAEDERIARGFVILATILSGRMPVDPTLLFRQAFSPRSEEHTSELQSRENLVCRL